jgi:hypothetical protein
MFTPAGLSREDGIARRAVRSNSLAHAPVSFIQCKSLPGDPLSIADISETGARVVIPERIRESEAMMEALQVGQVHEGWSLIGGYLSAPLRFRVVHVLPTHEAGIQFLEPSEHLKSMIRGFFEPEFVGASLWVDEEGGGAVLRYSNHRTCEVELRLADGHLSDVHVCVRKDGEIRDWARDPARALPVLRLVSNIPALDLKWRRAIVEKFSPGGLVA